LLLQLYARAVGYEYTEYSGFVRQLGLRHKSQGISTSRPVFKLTFGEFICRDITGRLTMQTSLGLPEDPII